MSHIFIRYVGVSLFIHDRRKKNNNNTDKICEKHSDIHFDGLLTKYRDCKKINYRVIQNYCWGFNNLSYTIYLRQEYVVAPMD
jgi:hypothetical protein